MSDHDAGDPISVVMTLASSAIRVWIPAESFAIASARSLAAIFGHGPESKAARAAATARSTSASRASGTLPTISSEWGETTSIVALLEGATHCPPM